MLEKIKDLLNKLLEDYPDKEALWDVWARRVIMGIDKTRDAAIRAQRANSVRFTDKSGHKDVDHFANEVITGTTAKFMPFAVKNHVTKAFVKWSESVGKIGQQKETDEAEAEMHMITAENLLDFC